MWFVCSSDFFPSIIAYFFAWSPFCIYEDSIIPLLNYLSRTTINHTTIEDFLQLLLSLPTSILGLTNYFQAGCIYDVFFISWLFHSSSTFDDLQQSITCIFYFWWQAHNFQVFGIWLHSSPSSIFLVIVHIFYDICSIISSKSAWTKFFFSCIWSWTSLLMMFVNCYEKNFLKILDENFPCD